MSEKKIIEKTLEPITKTRIKEALKTLGIQAQDCVLVHASLSSMGWVVGQEVTVIEALQEALSEGTLMMPSHSVGNSDPADWVNPPVPKSWIQTIYDHMPAFDPEKTPTRGMGRIAELFRRWPGVVRSNHPQTSFSAWGKAKTSLTQPHALTPMFGEASPLAHLLKEEGYVLLLGVGYDSCTLLHLAEFRAQVLEEKMTGCALIENGKRRFKKYLDFDYDDEDFLKLGEAFEQAHVVKKTILGNATLTLLDANALMAFAVPWLKAHRT